MAVYKVPQDVEADDKLLGPFSFKQFIFLIIAIASLALAWFLATILLPLGILPLPVALFFGALALPLRKDQPMEIYLAAVISFLLKPRVRVWASDGIESLIEVVAPKVEEKQYGKGYNQEEIHRRMSYLASIVDSHGWSVRGIADPSMAGDGALAMQSDLYNEAQATEDMLDNSNSTSRQINALINQADQQRRQDALNMMRSQPVAPASDLSYSTEPTNDFNPPATPTNNDQVVSFNPYPNMHQSVLSPLSDQVATLPAQQPITAPVASQIQQMDTYNAAASPTLVANPAPTPEPTHPIAQNPAPEPMQNTIDPDIIDLANNHSDLSVATLQREANRIQKLKQEDDEEEVVISLR